MASLEFEEYDTDEFIVWDTSEAENNASNVCIGRIATGLSGEFYYIPNNNHSLPSNYLRQVHYKITTLNIIRKIEKG